MVSDPYSVLGITRDADKEEIKKAYRRKAKECHPDLHPNDPKASEKMNEINEAYDILSNPEKYKKREQEASGYRTYTSGNTYRQSTYGQNPYGQRSYQGTQGNNRGYGSYGEYREFDFEDLFGFGQRHQEIPKPQRQTGDSDEITRVVDMICSERYEQANQVLNWIPSTGRNARWHYLSALANHGLGNEIRALEEIEKAIRIEPENQTYQQTYHGMRQSGAAYRDSRHSYQEYASSMGKYCTSLCALQFCCTFCRFC